MQGQVPARGPGDASPLYAQANKQRAVKANPRWILGSCGRSLRTFLPVTGHVEWEESAGGGLLYRPPKNAPKVMKRILAEKRSRKKKNVSSNGKHPVFFSPKSSVFKNRFISQKKNRGLKTVFFFLRNPARREARDTCRCCRYQYAPPCWTTE